MWRVVRKVRSRNTWISSSESLFILYKINSQIILTIYEKVMHAKLNLLALHLLKDKIII